MLCQLTAPAHLTLRNKMKNPLLNYDIGSVVTQSSYNIPLKALHACARVYKKYSTWGVSQDKYSTLFHLVLYLSLNMPPCAVFSVHTCGSALSNTGYSFCFNEFTTTIIAIISTCNLP